MFSRLIIFRPHHFISWYILHIHGIIKYLNNLVIVILLYKRCKTVIMITKF